MNHGFTLNPEAQREPLGPAVPAFRRESKVEAQ